MGLGAFAGRRVLLTGDTGFKGSWLAMLLVELGAEVTGFSLPPLPANLLYPDVARHIRHIDGDIRDLAAVRSAVAVARPEFVFHLAAQALVRLSYDQPQPTFATNLMGSVNVLEAVRLADGIRSAIFITSDKCYRDKAWVWGYRENDELGGSDPYSASKACAELALEAYRQSFLADKPGLGAASVRAGNVIGGGDRAADRIVPDTIGALEAGKPVLLRSPRSIRPWQHVLNPLCGYLELAAALAIEPGRFSGSWNFGPGENGMRTVEELARALVSAWGTGEIRHEPEPDQPHEVAVLHLSSEKANRELGWRALWGFERSAMETARWYREVGAGRRPIDASREQIRSYLSEKSRAAAPAARAS